MKPTFTLFSASLFFLFFACKQAPVSDDAKVTEPQPVQKETTGATEEVLVADTTQSKVEWIGTKVSGYHSGSVKIKSGQINLKDGKVHGGKFVMDMNTIVVSGPEGSKAESNAKLQKHLKSDDFFGVANNPEAVFEITEIKPNEGVVKEDPNDGNQKEISKYKVSDPTHLVSGNLTIKGISKNIQFPARITVTPDYAEAIAKFNIDRRDWNITYPGQPDDLIRNEIHLGISLMAPKAKS